LRYQFETEEIRASLVHFNVMRWFIYIVGKATLPQNQHFLLAYNQGDIGIWCWVGNI
jgi:hypothetical protein